MRILLSGLNGPMGAEVAKLCAEGFRGAELVAGVDYMNQTAAVPCAPDFRSAETDVDCIVDFSHHSLTAKLTAYAVARQLPLVIATTGQTEEELRTIQAAADRVPVLLASNFSLGIVVLTALARQAVRAFPDADIEIVETHHNRKLDVPSGTALTLAKAVQRERPGSRLVIGRHENGKRSPSDIDIHSLRMGNIPGTHEIHIGTDTQTLVLRHEAHDRAIFAEGALAAARWIQLKAPGLYTMEQVMQDLIQ